MTITQAAAGATASRGAARRDTLTAQGARQDWNWHSTANATLAWDDKRLLMAIEIDIPDPEWRHEVLPRLREVRALTGDRMYDDIGEPGYDPVSQVWTWDLTRTRP